MQNTPSRLEKRLVQLLATAPPLAARHTSGRIKIDLVYLSAADQDLLNSRLRE